MDMIIWAVLVIQVALDIVGVAALATLVVIAVIAAVAKLAFLADGVMLRLADRLLDLDGIDQNFLFWAVGVVMTGINTLVMLATILVLYIYVKRAQRRRRRDTG
ncbi:hypothetical protein D6779_05260 [Candidatus Parcubacteria bacterium]|nr:MAG: hypothetical protein D6779_05260 [Candidatus Parcubacteria bacterium]